MVTAVGVLEWIQETHLYTQASKQVPLERVAQPLRSLAATVDENINKDFAQKIISDGQHLFSDLQDRAINTSAVQSVRGRGSALCAFVRSSALSLAALASQAIDLIKNFQEQFPVAKSNYFIAQLVALICLVLSFVVSTINARFQEQPATPAPAAPATKPRPAKAPKPVQ